MEIKDELRNNILWNIDTHSKVTKAIAAINVGNAIRV